MIVNGTQTGKAYVEAQEYWNPFLYMILTEAPLILTLVLAIGVIIYFFKKAKK